MTELLYPLVCLIAIAAGWDGWRRWIAHSERKQDDRTEQRVRLLEEAVNKLITQHNMRAVTQGPLAKKVGL